MSNDVAEKLSREVGALDRALQNKFSEYENLSRKDINYTTLMELLLIRG
jgi:hypothetical protein